LVVVNIISCFHPLSSSIAKMLGEHTSYFLVILKEGEPLNYSQLFKA
jgi:hypothetical protein